MAPERLRRLEKFGIRWTGIEERAESQDRTWDRTLESLKEFLRLHGRRPVRGRGAAESRLANWIATQSFLLKRERLADDRARRLQSLGLSLEGADPHPPEPLPRSASSRRGGAGAWLRDFDALAEFKRLHGHCRVPRGWKENPRLSPWIIRQRFLKRRGKLRPDRLERLERLGLEWSGALHRKNLLDRRWDRMFQSLLDYRKTEGHCDVPLHRPGASRLGLWVRHQRRLHQQGRLRPDRIRQLESVKFAWNGAAARKGGVDRLWERKFLQLRSQVGVRGSEAAIPAALDRWLARQRKRRTEGTLSPDQKRRLEDLGISWNAHDARWDRMYSELRQYRSLQGDCLVPVKWPEYPALGQWVALQRFRKKAGTLSEARRNRLSEIGFDWKSKDVGRVLQLADR